MVPAFPAGSFLPIGRDLPHATGAKSRKCRRFALARFLLIHAGDRSIETRRVPGMSLFGALSTAISGLNAQSAAFGNISDNVANSQTTGFKRVDTSFVDYLTTSTAKENEPGAVVAQPDYVNNVQGTRLIPFTQVRLNVVFGLVECVGSSGEPHPCGDCPAG
ncbi:MAG: flagellar basal body protein [Rhodopila sp.]